MDRDMPGVLWVAVIACGLMGFGKIVAVLFGMNPSVLVDAALTLALTYGLYRGRRWALVLLLLSVGLGVGNALRHGQGNALGVLLGDSIVVVPVLLSWDYFSAVRNDETR